MDADGIGHAATLERLEDAALERGGIARLLASDADVAAHLETCTSCAAERDAWLRVGDAISDALASGRERSTTSDALPADLSRRTLERVAAQGTRRPRPQDGPAMPVAPGPADVHRGRPRLRSGRPWLLAAAAAIAVLVGGTAVADLANQRDQMARQRDQAQQEANQLADLTSTLDALLEEPDHRLAALTASGASTPRGTVVWGSGSGRLAVVTADLPRPPAGSEYRCWVERGGTRTTVGAMEFGAALAYWAGWVDPASGIGLGSVFGVSLVPLAGGPGPASPPPAVLSASF